MDKRFNCCLILGFPVAAIQVLNEFVHVARNKLRHDWPQIEFALGLFRASLDDVAPLALTTHAAALLLARDHRLSFYDALIVAAAVEAGCDTLYSADMQHGRKFGARDRQSVRLLSPILDVRKVFRIIITS